MHGSPERDRLIRTANNISNIRNISNNSNNNYTNIDKSSSSSSRLMESLPRLWRLMVAVVVVVVVVTPRGLALAGKRRTPPPPYGARSDRRNGSNTVRHLADVLVKFFFICFGDEECPINTI